MMNTETWKELIQMTKKWKVLAPLMVTALGALTAGIVTLTRKPREEERKTEAPKAAPVVPEAKNTLDAGYSFISGFQDAVTVEVRLRYDGDLFSYAVVEDEFISESGDSHVAILWGEKLNVQFEYASYYAGEDFEALRKAFADKFKDCAPVSYGDNEGIRFRDGDNLCLAFPIPNDRHSYLLVTLVKAKDNDDDLLELTEYPEVRAILGSLRFELR